MSTEQKVELVTLAQEGYGLESALQAVELPRSTWYYHQKQKVDYAEKYAHLLPYLEEIAQEHTSYGYRRTTVELQEAYGITVNHKVVQRLHRLWNLVLMRRTQRPQSSGIRQVIVAAGNRVNLVVGLKTIDPCQVVYTDFTELSYADGNQKAYLMPIIDHGSKYVFGWAVGERADSRLALRAWQQAIDMFQHLELSYQNLIVHHDQDSVYTGYAWTSRLLLDDGVRLSYTLNGARGNTEMEAFFSRFKNEFRSLLLETRTLRQLDDLICERMNYFNKERRHSAVNYQTPYQALIAFMNHDEPSLRSH